ncbi:hypothetical protein HPULCUR_008397 [Helicostylum pulchrum]|uniref:Uncharacterized protein n=1 Tax=Helicostylum pulchrum TaxID=562976 RepID=A0ABP9Y7H8_9FUNG
MHISQDLTENNFLWKKKTTQTFIYEGEEYDSDNSLSHHQQNHTMLRRPRAETMPTQSTCFRYNSLVLVDNTNRNDDKSPLTINATTNLPFGSGIFDNDNHIMPQHQQQHWMGDILTSPTTPTTDQLLKGDDNNTIASTFASLGLNDDASPSSSSSRSFIHASHSYSSLQTLCENGQDTAVSAAGETISSYYRGEQLRSSVANLRLQQQNRPRAQSAVEQEQQQQQRSIWSDTPRNFHHRPFLRSSNSSADLLEMIARQRKATATCSSPTIMNEDMQSIDSSGVWTGESGSFELLMDNMETESVMSTNASNNQIPSRSLWLGQLDLNTYGANELNMIFSKFGVIESIRILPDRECAFINFFTVEEASRAKDTLVNKMSSRLCNHHLVKVGFGKSDTPTSTIPSPITTDNVQGPTRALWVGNIPTNTTQQTLGNIFSCFGMIESIRVLTHKNCGFINFYTQEEAVRAKRSCQNREIMGPGTGTVRIGFAKVPAVKLLDGSSSVDVVQQQQQQQQQQQILDNTSSSSTANTPIPTNFVMEDQHMMMYMMEFMNNTPAVSNAATNTMFSAVVTERKLIMQDFGEDDSDGPTFDVLHLPTSYYHSIPAAPELGQSRKVDISRLRDIRKRLDTGHITVKELEVIAVECVDELVELCSDYIGNTVIQRLFERCSEMTKSIMLEAVAPFLASIGVHKNGTWAAQKIIDTAKLPAQISIVCGHIKPYVPSLLLDQFGNYVVQCCLGLGPNRNQFIFDAIVDSCWEIAQGRFGARAVRATLESPHVTKRQQKYVAASLVQHALLLATNANGALLLIWLLDTSGIPGRYRVLAPRLIPHLARLCTHKLASLTVLKLINQRQEPDARSLILETLFFGTTTVTVDEILHDQVHGVSLVQKILSSSYIELRERQRIAERVKQLLGKLKLQHVQGYKRLMEEINMVMVDSAPGASLGVPPPNNHQFSISPSLAAALHAKYMGDEGGDEAAAMMANFYAAAAAAAAAELEK